MLPQIRARIASILVFVLAAAGYAGHSGVDRPMLGAGGGPRTIVCPALTAQPGVPVTALCARPAVPTVRVDDDPPPDTARLDSSVLRPASGRAPAAAFRAGVAVRLVDGPPPPETGPPAA